MSGWAGFWIAFGLIGAALVLETGMANIAQQWYLLRKRDRDDLDDVERALEDQDR